LLHDGFLDSQDKGKEYREAIKDKTKEKAKKDIEANKDNTI